MQDFVRRFAYFYAYESGERLKNAGFVKLIARGRDCSLSICLKKERCFGEASGTAYIYFDHGGRAVCIRLGELKEDGGALKWSGSLDPADVLGKGIALSDTGGIRIRRPQGPDCAAAWTGAPVDVSRFILYPKGGQKCIRCPRFGYCERSMEDASDGR